MTHTSPPSAGLDGRTRRLGLPVLALIGLAALGLPRVVLHDLHLIDEAQPASWLLALGPVAVWILVAVRRKVPNPFLTVLVIGLVLGVMVVVTHQVLWDQVYADNPAFLSNGNAAGFARLAVIPGGLFAGALLGTVGGVIARGAQAVVRARSARR